MKKYKFKKLVKEKCKNIALKYLLEDNEGKSKLNKLKYYELSMQNYLKTEEMTTKQKKYLFRFRTQMIRVGFNYGNKIHCPLCVSKQDYTQEHLFECFAMKLHSSKLFNIKDEQYEDIYSQNVQKLVKISRICESVEITREKLIRYISGYS